MLGLKVPNNVNVKVLNNCSQIKYSSAQNNLYLAKRRTLYSLEPIYTNEKILNLTCVVYQVMLNIL